MYELETVVKKLKTGPDDAPDTRGAAAPVRDAANPGAANPVAANPEASGPIPIWIKKRAEADAPAAPAAQVAAFSESGPANMAKPAEQPRERKKRSGPPLGPVATMLGAACSIALVLGVSVWTYNLGKRDAMEVPVIQAMTGPARSVPVDRGGITTPHQGLAVNQVLEGGGVRPVARSVVTAPSKDTLAEEDVTRKELDALIAANAPKSRPTPAPAPEPTPEPAQGEVVAAAVAEIAASAVETPPVQTPETQAQTTGQATEQAVAKVDPTAQATSAQDVAPQRPVVTEDITTRSAKPELAAIAAPDKPVEVAALIAAQPTKDVADDAEPVAVVAVATPPAGSGSQFAPATILRSKSRPRDLGADLSNAVNAAVEAAVASAAQAEATPAAPVSSAQTQANLDVIPLPAGTRMIQLGAYDSEAVARREWARFQSRHSDLLGGKDIYVQRTDSSGRIFYRLRVAGYETRGDTRAACSALSARGVPCITATVR